jgi:electron transfer flavoprotein beta subunit
MLAEFLGIPSLTFVKHLDVEGTTFTAHRETPTGHVVVRAEGPLVVSVVEAINEPRYPTFKGIMAAKKKPLEQHDLAAVGVAADEVGLDGSRTYIVDISPRPPKEAGRVVTDDGTGQVGSQALADWLVEQKII